MASTGKIVKILKEKNGKYTVMTSLGGRKQVSSLDEVLEIVKSEYAEN